MGHAITVDVPQDAYESLARTARQTGQTLEELAALWLASVARQVADDPLEKFIGAISTNVPDWTDMKKSDDDELAEEYDLASLPIMPKGRYAPERRLRKNLVVLDADLVQAFPNDEAVNKALRLVVQIAHIPQTAATP